MNKKHASSEIIDRFLRLVNKYNALGKHPVTFGTQHRFYHSERHMLDIVGDCPDLNITEFAKAAGVTKGAISQVVAKLEKKGAKIKLTPLGEKIYAHHQSVNAESSHHLWRELKNHPDDNIEFLLHMFKWFEEYFDESRERMRAHQ
ncbi:MAG: MarR family transcriptional regulator [Desulfobulbaceae bacterium]